MVAVVGRDFSELLFLAILLILVETSTEFIYGSEYLCWSGSIGVSKYQVLM